MKKLLLILILIVFGCKDTEETESIKMQEQENEKGKNKRKDKKEKTTTYADMVLKLDAEKLALLSIIKKIPNDTLHLVLKDYIDKTFPLVTDVAKIDKIIDNISQKYHISKVKIASIVFSYNYEMLTKDEIEQSAIENEQDNNQE
ncbi:hypothetical protein [Flavobacterium sp. XS2P14]|uniref:hypothetical protein n=1 Tax=Flavobacterium sp. XS2P14 TaxID=3401735 RepID=UPI003AB08C0E